MATPGPGFSLPTAEFAAAMLAQREVAPRARVLADHIGQLFNDVAVVVYIVDESGGCWKPVVKEGQLDLSEPTVPLSYGTLGSLFEERQALIYGAGDLEREEYAHLNVRRSFQNLAYLPLQVEERLIGAIEIVSYSQALDGESLAPAAELADLATVGIFTALEYESERQATIESLARMTSLYELEVAFNSTLEMDAVMNIITSKIQDLLNAQAVNLWLVSGEGKLLLMNRAGEDPSHEIGTEIDDTSDIPGSIGEDGEGALVTDENDPRLSARYEGVEEGRGVTAIAVALMHDGAQVGVLEAINKLDGTVFDDTDLFLLQTIGEAAAGSLHNASLYNAEKKVQILETLVRVSTEITSTLNLERVLQTIVNGAQAIIPYERAAIGLEHHGKFQLKAVSGMPEINRGDPDVARLREMLEWASIHNREIYVNLRDGAVDENREEARAKFTAYFAAANTASFYAMPLEDDQGRVGMLSLESTQPDFLEDAHLEILKVLAAQATVALRNAELYREVPFIGLLEPIIQKKQKFLSMETRRRRMSVGLAAAVAALLIVVPLPMRIAGNATVSPARSVQVQPKVDGVIKAVYVREGDPVRQGTILADLEDSVYRSALASAQAKLAAATAARNEALARNDGGVAGVKGIDVDYWTSEVKRAKDQLESTHVRSTIDGVVTTPHVENFVGKRMEHGDSFAQVADTGRALVDVAIDESDLTLIHAGTKAAVKLEGFPASTFKGDVEIISPQGQAQADSRVFYARVNLANPDGVIRPGMQGRGKVSAGWHSAGYVLFRGLGMWAWTKLWNWFGW
jgi:GAF domain-containing protein